MIACAKSVFDEMNWLLYVFALAVVKFFQALPLEVVARIGRAGGGLAHGLDARHRRVARENLRAAFPEKSLEEIRALALENFKRLGECYCSAIKTADMDPAELRERIEFVGAESLLSEHPGESRIFAIGHFGNFELYARGNFVAPEFAFATTYRGLNQPGLNRVLTDLRSRSGCLCFERRTESEALRAAVRDKKIILGFLSDQHAGRSGAWLPFFGRLCSTTTAPAVFALRYKMPLYTAICYRTEIGCWRIEIGREIPTVAQGERRSVEDIMLDVNREFEKAIRLDPANWFWVHRRWKPAPPNVAAKKSDDSKTPEPAAHA
jgi:lauroyl/myristoyl acyltransferase